MIEEYIGWLDDDWNTVLDLNQPIVRCKDCTFYTDELGLSEVKPEREYCERYSHYDGEWDVDVYHYTEPDDFCSFGKRKEVE